MLNTRGGIGSAANPKETKSKVDGNSVVGNIVGGDKAINLTKGENQAKTTKSKILVKSKNHDFPKFKTKRAGTSFFTPKARLAFT